MEKFIIFSYELITYKDKKEVHSIELEGSFGIPEGLSEEEELELVEEDLQNKLYEVAGHTFSIRNLHIPSHRVPKFTDLYPINEHTESERVDT